MRYGMIILVSALFFLGFTSNARAYLVANALSLEDLKNQADLVCKAVVVSTQPVKDDWFNEVRGFEVKAAELKVISVIKGKSSKKTINFHYYAAAPGDIGIMYQPQNYHFTAGRAYIIFAKQTPDQRIFRQLWKAHRSDESQGVLLAADKSPHTSESITQIFLAELTNLLNSQEAQDVIYAIKQLDRMSDTTLDNLQNFDRRKVLEVIKPQLDSKNSKVVELAIRAMGSRNPYLSEGFAAGWLGTIGQGYFPGLGKWDLEKKYLGGTVYWKELAAVANAKGPLDNRALAIRALGRTKQAKLFKLAEGWVKDVHPEIRQAGALLLADFPKRVKEDVLKSLAEDPSGLVRKSAARLIGFGRFSKSLPILGRLIHDRDPKVAAAGALSLLSFSVTHNQKILEANLEHPQFKSLFINALAGQDPKPYLESLGLIIRKGLRPDHWWGGRVPWGISWEILFFYAQKQPAQDLKTKTMNGVFDSLESPLADNPDSPKYYSSSEPRDLYALYLQRGLEKRARKFRQACKKVLSYDIDYYFDMVDKNPSTYQRR
ncbi:MAG: HEAT repeat domain-containing protein [Deltaproteobacteria bacterium]|nr:HEAT repeat domain-containing protein [Deltaproteobacteria bacterium]